MISAHAAAAKNIKSAADRKNNNSSDSYSKVNGSRMAGRIIFSAIYNFQLFFGVNVLYCQVVNILFQILFQKGNNHLEVFFKKVFQKELQHDRD